ncbi:MAG: undecaprenyl-phosphate glucose phosphotransferase [Bacteroidota bacterium]|nr:undecaprenyl-phosphate glucose phosphotransferase [Bacteroidota bacterium]
MNRKLDTTNIAIDFLTINLAWSLYFFLRTSTEIAPMSVKPDFWLPMFTVYIYWLIVFFFYGLYRSWHAASRTDEFLTILKAVSVGSLILFFVIFLNDINVQTQITSRLIILMYWGIMLLAVGSGRVVHRTARRRLLESGIGRRNTVIVGWNKRGHDLFDLVQQHPALGHKIIGFVKVDRKKASTEYKNVKVLGTVENLPSLISSRHIKDVLIALESDDHNKLLEVISCCNGHDVSMKIMPDMYDIISGQARTNQLYGFPLIEVMPEIMQPWEESAKRLMDIIVSLLVLTISAPLWLIIGAAIRIDSEGPIVYSQERVGKEEKIFKMHKFRSMRNDAEKNTGPVWAPVHDTRVTHVGRFLRNTRLDEIPQFINVLRGEMSLVGPRPERPFFVEKLSKEIPLYHRRLKVRPGITGWAQVKQGYDRSIDDVRSKVRYDLFYIENMSLRMDIKILLYTFYVMLTGKGH